MADEVLKLIVTVDSSKAVPGLKGVEDAANKVAAANQKAAQSSAQHGQTASAMHASIMQSANLMAQQMAGTSASTATGLATIEKGAAGVGQAFTAAGFSGEAAMTALGGPMAVVTGAIVAQATALGAFSKAIIDAGVQYHDVMAMMAGRTGETGEALEGLGRDFIQVFSGVPQSANEVAEVMAKLHQRFDLTGASLQEVSRMMLDFSRVTGTPVKAALDSLVDVMSSWDLKARDMPRLIDMMTVAFQKSGVEVPKMAGYLEGNDAALKQFGFTLIDSIALIATLEKRGVNVQKIMTGFNKAAPAFAEAGIDPIAGFENAVRLIRELDNEHALLIAKQTFGAKVAVEFADAIRSGAFDAYDMKLALEGSAGALELTAANSLTLTDQFKLMQHAIQSLLTPLGSQLVGTLEKFAIPAFAVLAFKLSETVYWMEYLAGIDPKLSKFDLQKAGVGGAAPALPMQQINELSGRAPRQRSAAMSFADYMAKMKDKGTTARAEKEVDAAKFDRDFRSAELGIFQSFDRAGDQFQKNWQSRLRGTADLSLKELQNHEKAAAEILKQNGEIRVTNATTETQRVIAQHELDRDSFLASELFKTATAEQQGQLRANFEELFYAKQDAMRRKQTEDLEKEISLNLATISGRNPNESQMFALLEKQRQEKDDAIKSGRTDINRIEFNQGIEIIKLQQQQYDTMFGKVKTQAEGVFDAIFLRGKKGFAGLLDYIKGTFITGLKDLFGNIVATLFTGSRPGGGGAAQGGLFGGIAQLFGGGARAGGGGGGLFSGLGSLFGGGRGIAGTPPFLPARSGFGGGLGSLLGLGGTGAGIAGAAGLGTTAATLTPGVAAALPTTFANTGLMTAGTTGGIGGAGGLATLGALLSNPITIAAGIGLAATILYLKLRKSREDKFRQEILRDFALNVVDNKLLKLIKSIGESTYGKDADRKRFETIRLDSVQRLLFNHAQMTGQSAAKLPIYERFFGKLSASNQRFDPSAGIPRFAQGGVVPGVDRGYDSVLSMLRPGEAVVPKAQFSPLGGTTSIVVNVNESKNARETGREVMRQIGTLLGRDIGRRAMRDGLFGV